jgi:type IV pilus assembly protein PilM
MANPRFAWGIDIGNRALKAIKLVRDGDAMRVDDFDVIEHETVLSNSGDNREQLILNAINQFVAKHPMKGGAVSIGVSGQSSFARFIKLPPVEPKKIPEIVRFEAIQQIPFPLDDVEWSYQLFQSADSPDVEVGIFAMRKELIGQHIKYFTDADLNVQVVQMNPLAVYNGMSYDGRVDGTTMIIDLGAENTDLIIADADTIWLRSIPIGGNNFTEALVKSFKLNFAKAEDLKRNAATSKYARQIFQAMRPVFADLVAEVQRSIGFYASVHRDSRINRIVAVGGTFKLPGLQKYLQQNLQLNVERLDTIAAGAPPDPKQAAMYQDNILSLVSSYGLALQAMGEGKITSSLLPARIRRERLWQEKTKFFAAAAALFVAGTAIPFASIFFADARYQAQADSRSKIQQVQSQAQALDTQWTDISGKGGADRQRILNVRSLTDYRDVYNQILQDISNSLPNAGQTPEQLKASKRSERRQIMIDEISNTYVADLATLPAELSTRFGPGAQQQQVTPTWAVGFSAPSAGAVTGAPGAEAAPADTSGMAPPAEAAPTDPSQASGLTGRGFAIRIVGRTPFQPAAQLLDETLIKALDNLKKDKIPNGKTFAVEKVQIMGVTRLRDDQVRLQKIQADFQAAVTAKESGTFTATSGGGATGFGGGMNPYGGGGGGFEGEGGGGGFGPGGGGFANNFTGAATPGVNPDALAAKAFMDREHPDEDVRDDSGFTIVAVISLDPPPKAPADPNAAPPPANGQPAAAPPQQPAASAQ